MIKKLLAHIALLAMVASLLGGNALAQDLRYGLEEDPPARGAVPPKEDPGSPLDGEDDSADGEDDCPKDTVTPPDATPPDPGPARPSTPGDVGPPCEDDTGDPVLLHNGMVSVRRTDLWSKGRGLDFEFSRRYNSKRSSTDGPLGFGWDHSHNVYIEVGSGTYAVHNGNNRVDYYIWNGSGFDSPPGSYARLKYDSATQSYLLRARGGTVTKFKQRSNPNILPVVDITDSDGNRLRYTYDQQDRVQFVRDAFGRKLNFFYEPTSGRVSSVQDFAGRTVTFAYDAVGTLKSVTSPAISSTGGFNDFPQGRTEYYSYYDATQYHSLQSIVRPADVVSATPPYGVPAVQFEYSALSNYLWCTKQILGGDNGNGAAGGEINYTYNFISSGPPDITKPRIKTTVVDRRGLVAEYVFNEGGNKLSLTEYKIGGGSPHVTLYEHDMHGQLTKVTYPKGNSVEYVYDTAGGDWARANILQIIRDPGPVSPTLQPIVTSFTYEPVFNRLQTFTDERGNVTTYVTDYMEGNAQPTSNNYVISAIASQLWISESQAAQLVGAYLQDQDLNGDDVANQVRGKLIQMAHPPVTLSALGGGPQIALEGDANQVAIDTWTYNAYGQVTSHTDAEENVSVYIYHESCDPNGTQGPCFIPDPHKSGGYLNYFVEDTSLPYSHQQLDNVVPRNDPSDFGRNSGTNPPTTEVRADVTYDLFGNMTAFVDGRGVAHEYGRNEMGEVWEKRRAADVSLVASRMGGADPLVPEDLSGQDFSYRTRYGRNANGELISVQIENLGNLPDQGAVSGFIEQSITRDILGKPRVIAHEYGTAGESATWLLTFDPNENLSTLVYPEGNSVNYTYDHRDLLETVVRAPGQQEEVTLVYAHDDNGNLDAITNGAGAATLLYYDGFDRRTETRTAVGSQWILEYDAASNVVRQLMRGHPGGVSPTNNDISTNIDFVEAELFYDERGRLFRRDRWDPKPQYNLDDGVLTPGDGRVTARMDFDRLGRRTFVIEDDGAIYRADHDGLGRVIRDLDPAGNERFSAYDDNGNLVLETQRDVYPDSSTRDFETYRIYDSLDRHLSETNGLGETSRWGYDSRDNQVAEWDAIAALNGQFINGLAVNGLGNKTEWKHDGLGRSLMTIKSLHQGGTGDGALDTSNPYNADGTIVVRSTWTRNGKLRTRTDDKGNVTTWDYDQLDRPWKETYADSSFVQVGYDPDHTIVDLVDPNGTVLSLDYDDVNRLTAIDAVSLGSGVVGTAALRYLYDGRGRRVMSQDSVDGALDANDRIVYTSYDALDRVTGENQAGKNVTSFWTEESKRTSVLYPTNLTVSYQHDALDRVSMIYSGAVTLETTLFAGPDRRLQRTLGNGVVEKLYTGQWDDSSYWDAARRSAKLDVWAPGGGLLLGFEYGLDRAGNRTYERRLHDAEGGDNLVYDSTYRVVGFERDVPAPDVGTPGGGNQQSLTDWLYDGVGNWSELVQDGTPSVNPVSSLNEYLTFGGATVQHDANGNELTDDAGAGPTLAYDFLNRLRVITAANGADKVYHDYDAQGRKFRTSTAGSVPGMPSFTEFVYDGWEVIEERDGTNGLRVRYILGEALDQPVAMQTLGYYQSPGLYYFQRSTIGSVVAITNTAGAVAERYSYDSFGAPRFESPSGNPLAINYSAYGTSYLHQSTRYEAGLRQLYYMRFRHYDSVAGRFLQRDPMGMWFDTVNTGNAYGFVGNSAWNLSDPFGLQGGPAEAAVAIGVGGWIVDAAIALVGTAAVAEGARQIGDALAPEVGDIDILEKEHTKNQQEQNRNPHERRQATKRAQKKKSLEWAEQQGNKSKAAKLRRDLGLPPKSAADSFFLDPCTFKWVDGVALQEEAERESARREQILNKIAALGFAP